MNDLNMQKKLPSSVLVYLLVQVLFWGLVSTAIAAFVGLGSSGEDLTLVWVVVFFVAISILYELLWYSTFSYLVGDQGVTINSGILFKDSKLINFGRIQNAETRRGPLQMIFGLTTLKL